MIEKYRSNSINIFYFTLFGITILYFAFLSTQFWASGDDMAFARWMQDGISWQNMVTVYGVNGRYLGNTLGILFSSLSMSSFWWIRALFNTICMVVLIIVSSKLTSNTNQYRTLCLSGVLLLSANEYAFVEFFSYSAGFMNYFVPTLLFFLNLFLVIKYKEKKTKKFLAVLICFIAFINCFFVELITVYIVGSAIAFFVYCLIKHENRLFSSCVLLCSFMGMIMMFSYGIICKDVNSVYRTSIFSKGIDIVFDNINQYSHMMLFSNLLLSLFISVVTFLFIYNKWRKKEKNTLVFVIQALICLFGIVVSFMLRFGNWDKTPICFLVSDTGVTIISIIYLLNLGAVLLDRKTDNNDFVLLAFFYISIWFLSGVLSMVSPIGWRCFLPIYVLFILIGISLFECISEDYSKIIDNLVIVTLFILFVIHSFCIGRGFYNAHKVECQREQYLSEQIMNHKTEVEVADSVSFADDGPLRFLKDYYYYKEPGDIDIKFVPYDEWLDTIYKNTTK